MQQNFTADLNTIIKTIQGYLSAKSAKKDRQALKFIKTIPQNMANSNLDIMFLLASVYYKNNNLNQAEAFWIKTLNLEPRHVNALWNLNILYKRIGNNNARLKCLQQLTMLQPSNINYLNELTACLIALGDFINAQNTAEKILANGKQDFAAMFNLANCCFALGQLTKAIAWFEAALAISPTVHITIDIHACLGLIHRRVNNFSQANYHYNYMLKNLNKIKLSKITLEGLRKYSFYCLEQADWQQLNEINKITDLTNNLEQFHTLMIPKYMERQKEIAISCVKKITASIKAFSHPKQIDFAKRNKIRIGYISSDFKQKHPTWLLLKDSIGLHDKDKFEVILYNVHKSNVVQDTYTLVDLSMLNFKQAATRIYQDQIDILIDLSMYGLYAKPQILAYQPAPIQCHYFGYAATSGASFMQYTILDQNWKIPNIEKYFTEKIKFLPNLAYTKLTPIKTATKAEYNLPDNKIILASFNKTYRINQELFDCWLKILRHIPDSILWLTYDTEPAITNFTKYAEDSKIDPRRIIFREKDKKLTDDWHVMLADICLDSFVISGGTSSYLSLIAGVPLVTLRGKYPHQKLADSLLINLGLDELIAKNPEEYIDTVVKLANDAKYYQYIKQTIDDNLSTSPIFNLQQYVDNLENCFIEMLEDRYTHCSIYY